MRSYRQVSLTSSRQHHTTDPPGNPAKVLHLGQGNPKHKYRQVEHGWGRRIWRYWWTEIQHALAMCWHPVPWADPPAWAQGGWSEMTLKVLSNPSINSSYTTMTKYTKSKYECASALPAYFWKWKQTFWWENMWQSMNFHFFKRGKTVFSALHETSPGRVKSLVHGYSLSPCLGKPYSYTNWSILKLITNTVHVMVILLFHKYLQLHTHIYSKTCTFRLCLMQNLVLSYLCVFPQSIKIIPCRNPAGLGAGRERATANCTL